MRRCSLPTSVAGRRRWRHLLMTAVMSRLSLVPVGPLRPVYCKMRDATCTKFRSFAEDDGGDRFTVANSTFS